MKTVDRPLSHSIHIPPGPTLPPNQLALRVLSFNEGVAHGWKWQPTPHLQTRRDVIKSPAPPACNVGTPSMGGRM
jgi:hypothetical protein